MRPGKRSSGDACNGRPAGRLPPSRDWRGQARLRANSGPERGGCWRKPHGLRGSVRRRGRSIGEAGSETGSRAPSSPAPSSADQTPEACATAANHLAAHTFPATSPAPAGRSGPRRERGAAGFGTWAPASPSRDADRSWMREGHEGCAAGVTMHLDGRAPERPLRLRESRTPAKGLHAHGQADPGRRTGHR